MHCPHDERGTPETRWLKHTALQRGEHVWIWMPETPGAWHGKVGTFLEVNYDDGRFLVLVDGVSSPVPFEYTAVARKFEPGERVRLYYPDAERVHEKSGIFIQSNTSSRTGRLVFQVILDGEEKMVATRHDVFLPAAGKLRGRLAQQVGPPVV